MGAGRLMLAANNLSHQPGGRAALLVRAVLFARVIVRHSRSSVGPPLA